MATESLDDTNFRTRLEATDLAVVDFYAGWCGPCMLFKPKFARLSESYPAVGFFVCDGEKAPESRKTIEIPSLPYFGLFRKGQFVRGFSTTKEEGFKEELEAEIARGAGATP